MARQRSATRSRGSSRLPSARVAWLPAPDTEIGATLTSAALLTEATLFDFGSAQKYADNYGGGDWTVQRMVGSIGLACVVAGASSNLVKVCFGIGMLNARTTVSDSPAAQASDPNNFPELSWMAYACCYINVGDALRVERCDFDFRSKRIISERSLMVFSISAAAMPATAQIEVEGSVRTLVRQRGSRL